MKPDRKNSTQRVPFDLSDPVSKAAWEALLLDGADLSAFEEGDMIYDAFSSITLELRQSSTERQWQGLGCLVMRAVVSEDVLANHLGKISGPPAVWETCDVEAEAAYGVFMANAQSGQRAYIIAKGCYPIVVGDQPLGFISGVSTDALGRARPIQNFGEFYIGFNVEDPTIGGVDYVLSTINTEARFL